MRRNAKYLQGSCTEIFNLAANVLSIDSDISLSFRCSPYSKKSFISSYINLNTFTIRKKWKTISEGDVEVLIPLWVLVVAYHPGPSHDRPSNADRHIWVAGDHVLVVVAVLVGPLIAAVSVMICLGLAPAM